MGYVEANVPIKDKELKSEDSTAFLGISLDAKLQTQSSQFFFFNLSLC